MTPQTTALWLMGAAIMLAGGMFLLFRTRRMNHHGVCVKADVIEVVYLYFLPRVARVKVAYEDAFGIRREQYFTKDVAPFSSPIKAGDQFRIIYDRNNPQRSISIDCIRNYILPVGWVLLGVLTLIVPLLPAS